MIARLPKESPRPVPRLADGAMGSPGSSSSLAVECGEIPFDPPQDAERLLQAGLATFPGQVARSDGRLL